MNFELGKTYIVDVTEKGIVPLLEFDEDRWFDKDHDDLDFLTDEEKALVVNGVLDKIRAEVTELVKTYPFVNHLDTYVKEDDVLEIIDKYKADKKDCTTCIGFGDKDYAQSFCHDCVKDIQNHYKAESEDKE